MWSLSIMLNLMNSMKKKIITGINKQYFTSMRKIMRNKN